LLAVASNLVAEMTKVTRQWQWTVIAAAAGQSALAIALTIWQVQGYALRYGALQITNSAFNIGATIWLVAAFGLGWEGRAIAQALTTVALGSTALIVIARSGMFSWRFRREHITAALRFGVPLIPHSIAAVALANMDRLILAGAVGAVDTGVYFVAFQISSVLTVFAAAINQAWVPWLYQHLSKGGGAARERVVKLTYAMFGLYAAMAAVLIMVGPSLVRLLAGEQYSVSAGLLVMLAPAAALSGMYYLVVNYVFYANRTEVMSTVTTVTAIVQAVLTIGLAKTGGAFGVSLATLLSTALYFGLTWYAAARLVPMPWLKLRRGTMP
jgi:O-antigen/teichoic acid export membrane protein